MKRSDFEDMTPLADVETKLLKTWAPITGSFEFPSPTFIEHIESCTNYAAFIVNGKILLPYREAIELVQKASRVTWGDVLIGRRPKQ